MKKKALMTIGLLFVLALLKHAPSANAQTLVWKTNPTPLPMPLYEHEAILYDNRMYVIGGTSTDGSRRSTVDFAEILSDGTVGTWTGTTPLPEPRVDHIAVLWNNFIYVIGGSTTGSVMRDTVYRAQILSDGNLGMWETMTPLPEALTTHTAVAWGERIYVMGGLSTTQVFYTDIQPDGSLGSWKSTTSLTTPCRSAASAVHHSVIYVIGGQYPGAVYQKTVYYARINSDGSIGSWTAGPEIPDGREQAEAVIYNSSLYVVGGSERGWEGQVYATVFKAEIYSDGTIRGWRVEDTLPGLTSMHAAVASDGAIYVLGGSTTCGTDGLKSTIYYAQLPEPVVDKPLDLRILIAISAAISITVICFATVALFRRVNRK